MKKIYYLLLALFASFAFVACNQNHPSNPGNPTEPWDPAEDEGLSQWESCLKHIKPGIYQGMTDEELGAGMNMGYDKNILAICEDGSAFYMDIKEGSVIAPFTCYDGKLTFTQVSASEPKKEVFNYDKRIKTYSKEPLNTLNNKLMDIETQLTQFAALFGFEKYFYKGTMIGKYYKKIDDAKDFKSTYEKIFQLAMKKGEYVEYNDLFTAEHVIYGDGWHNELYPSAMNSQRWVVPYDGTAKIERFAVYRQRDWGYNGKWYLFYGPCDYELVTWVECDVDCDKAEAIRWKNKITDMHDRYNYTVPGETVETDYVVGYGYDSNDDGLNLGEQGYKGYIRPTYDMEWIVPLSNNPYPMTIKFGVAWTTYV